MKKIVCKVVCVALVAAAVALGVWQTSEAALEYFGTITN